MQDIVCFISCCVIRMATAQKPSHHGVHAFMSCRVKLCHISRMAKLSKSHGPKTGRNILPGGWDMNAEQDIAGFVTSRRVKL